MAVDNTLIGNIQYGDKTLTYATGKEIEDQVNANILPNISKDQKIIGHTTTRDGIILFSSDGDGMDCIWKLNEVLKLAYELELLYVRNLGFSINNPIQALFNYENENIQKIYWVDGLNQIRFLNITHNSIKDNEPLIDVPSNTLDFTGEIAFSQPTIQEVASGGNHTSGMIQYAYNLYRLNSSQTKISPLSEIIPLDKGTINGGGELNENVGATPVVNIDSIDTLYTHIKVYAIKYTSLNEIPSISLIEDRELNGDSSVVVYDNGSIISTLSLEEFIFLGSNPIVPKHIDSKDNRLFFSNIKTKEFIIPDELDCRAYSFPSTSTTTTIWDNITISNDVLSGIITNVNSSDFILSLKSDAINNNYDINKYLPSSTTFGAEGKFLKFEIVQKSLVKPEEFKLLKDREIYRYAIEFRNKLGQTSLPIWITDYKTPSGNLVGNYNTVKVTLKTEFYTWLSNYNFIDKADIPVGYKILRADRTLTDRTIICQGILSGMMVNTPITGSTTAKPTLQQAKDKSEINRKIPNILLRTFKEISPLQANSNLASMQLGSNTQALSEIQYDPTERVADTFQYTTMYQMYSPEITFDNVSINSSTRFNIIGGANNSNNSIWGQERKIVTKQITAEEKTSNRLSPHASGAINTTIVGNTKTILDTGLVYEADNGTDTYVGFSQFYREFDSFITAPNLLDYGIYKAPEITERGQGDTTYGNDSIYKYNNTLEGFSSDGHDDGEDGTLIKTIVNINSHGAKCVTFVTDDTNISIPSYNRKKLEDLYTFSGINNTNVALISELVRPKNDSYIGGIYGGNNYEDKKRTVYISIGGYSDINIASIQIDNAGDTHVDNFRFLRIAKTNIELYSLGNYQYTELVSVKLETTIDLKNRNDTSNTTWDGRFQPSDSEYHNYNNVYSQQAKLIQTTDVESTFRRIKSFDTRIQTSKLKIPNETIDSWSDVLVNEVMDLDGRYGPINSIVSFKDNIYAFQDEGIASISINPRVQVQGSDGVGLELGTGGILYDYNYITTKSGSINKWGIVVTKKGVYYYDALNKSINRIPDSFVASLSDTKGLHTFFNNNYNYNDLKIDNPLLRTGVVFGYDNYNNDVYFTLLQSNGLSSTRCYNELIDQFVDLKSYKPSMYITKGDKFIGVDRGNTKLYQHNSGLYNYYYGEYSPSYIILQINPESDISCVFNSVFFNSELYLEDVDQSNKTITHIQAYNEYQDSGRIPLIVGRNSNLRRKFREWKAEIPRDGRERIRNPWIYLKLELDNTSNYKMILHDIIISYSI